MKITILNILFLLTFLPVYGMIKNKPSANLRRANGLLNIVCPDLKMGTSNPKKQEKIEKTLAIFFNHEDSREQVKQTTKEKTVQLKQAHADYQRKKEVSEKKAQKKKIRKKQKKIAIAQEKKVYQRREEEARERQEDAEEAEKEKIQQQKKLAFQQKELAREQKVKKTRDYKQQAAYSRRQFKRSTADTNQRIEHQHNNQVLTSKQQIVPQDRQIRFQHTKHESKISRPSVYDASQHKSLLGYNRGNQYSLDNNRIRIGKTKFGKTRVRYFVELHNKQTNQKRILKVKVTPQHCRYEAFNAETEYRVTLPKNIKTEILKATKTLQQRSGLLPSQTRERKKNSQQQLKQVQGQKHADISLFSPPDRCSSVPPHRFSFFRLQQAFDGQKNRLDRLPQKAALAQKQKREQKEEHEQILVQPQQDASLTRLALQLSSAYSQEEKEKNKALQQALAESNLAAIQNENRMIMHKQTEKTKLERAEASRTVATLLVENKRKKENREFADHLRLVGLA